MKKLIAILFRASPRGFLIATALNVVGGICNAGLMAYVRRCAIGEHLGLRELGLFLGLVVLCLGSQQIALVRLGDLTNDVV